MRGNGAERGVAPAAPKRGVRGSGKKNLTNSFTLAIVVNMNNHLHSLPLREQEVAEGLFAHGSSRVHHFIDIENLLRGSASCTTAAVARIQRIYSAATGLAGSHKITLACGPTAAKRGALFGFCPDRGRRVVSSGIDGADDALCKELDQLDGHQVDVVVIASGDHKFAAQAAWLQSRGIEVFVVVLPGCLSRRLRLAVKPSNVIYLETLPPESAALKIAA